MLFRHRANVSRTSNICIFALLAGKWHLHEFTCRDLGKTLFMDEDHMQVPFLAGSMTDDAFVSESNPLGATTGAIFFPLPTSHFK